MIGVMINVISIVCGGSIGSLIKKNFDKKISDAVLNAVGIFTFFIGIQGALKGEKSIVVLFSIIVGTVIGTIIDIDKKITKFGEWLKKIFVKKNSDNAIFVEAFVSSSVVFGIGAMAILGSIEAGINNKYDILILKSSIDFVTAIMFSATMGIGVCFSAITIFIMQGSMTLCASLIKPIAENVGMMNEIICCGNLLIIAIGMNVMDIKKIKVANMLLSIFLVPFVYFLYTKIF